MNKVKYYSVESLEALKKELYSLETVERLKISKAIAEARDKGDLSENAEYDAAKEAQGMLELKIGKLKDIIANARILDESKIDTSTILIYSIVTIRNLSNNMEMTYTIVPEPEADFKIGKISINSPIAKGLLGKKKKDIATIQAPAGTLQFKIINISR
ncbi:MAG: transcription elongation factor GreA [Bacteroidales bacterium]|jgi:transcription elongation factor GreA|nr:transcription elongation factor GreA [Bacteroidales bacterium]